MATHPLIPFVALADNAHEQDAEHRKMLLLTSAAAGVAVVGTAVPLVASFAPSERALASGTSVEAVTQALTEQVADAALHDSLINTFAQMADHLINIDGSSSCVA